MTLAPQNIKLIIPKPDYMDSDEYRKLMKKLVKLLETLDIKVIAKDYENTKPN